MISETLDDVKSVQEQANLWITRLDKGLSSAEKQQLVAWMSQDKAHYNAIEKMSSLCNDSSVLQELKSLFSYREDKKSSGDYLMKFGLAASIVLVVLLSGNLITDINQLRLFSFSTATNTP